MSASGRTVAVTGATGFLGRHAVLALAAKGWKVRVLARSQPLHALWRELEPEVVLGSLADASALRRLVSGADAILHLAGLIKARDDVEFLRVNRDGTRSLAEATKTYAPDAHFLLVSSLAARTPTLSGYAASKRAAEEAAFEALDSQKLSVIRPSAIYGPGDRETLIFFQLARGRIVPLVGSDSARLALIHVEDAASALATRLSAAPSGAVQAIADDRPRGYSWREIFDAAASAVGNPHPRYIVVPRGLLRSVGATAEVLAGLFGSTPMINRGKVRELLHEDWSVPPAELLNDSPAVSKRALVTGFSGTAEWYRRAGWLHPLS